MFFFFKCLKQKGHDGDAWKAIRVSDTFEILIAMVCERQPTNLCDMTPFGLVEAHPLQVRIVRQARNQQANKQAYCLLLFLEEFSVHTQFSST
jgi:hypothetical protein